MEDYLLNQIDDEPNIKRIIFNEDLYNEDVIDETDLDSWIIDDFFKALPETIEYNDSICGLLFYYCYDIKYPCWIACYQNSNGDHIHECNGESPIEALEQLYKKINY